MILENEISERIELAQQGLRPADAMEAGWFVRLRDGRKVWATDAPVNACAGFGCVDGCGDCEETRAPSQPCSLCGDVGIWQVGFESEPEYEYFCQACFPKTNYRGTPLCPWCNAYAHPLGRCLQAAGGGPWAELKAKDAQIAALREQLDHAHQHVGALLTYSPLPQYAINEAQKEAITAARAWLQRKAK